MTSIPRVQAAATTFIVLLRGVNVSGANRVPMAELKAALAKAGYGDVRTYINSGNAVMTGTGTAGAVETEVEGILARRFKVDVPVMVRTAKHWATFAAGNPFPDAPGNLLYLGLAKAKPKADVVAALAKYAAKDDRIERVGEGLWIWFAEGAGKSRITSTVLDRTAGSPVTLRNWNTVQRLAALAKA